MGGQPATHHRAGTRRVLLSTSIGGGARREVRLADGAEIRLEEFGAGAPLVLIPGWACSIDVFRRNIPAFAQRYHVVAYDPRSQGRSDQTAKGNNYAQRGDDLLEVLDALNLDGVILLGWSLGVFDVLSYLDRHGFERARALVLVDESPVIIRTHADDWGEGSAGDIAQLIAGVNSPGYLPFFKEYIAAGFQGNAPEETLDRMAETAAALPAARAAALLEDAAGRDFRPVSIRAAKQVPMMQILREDWAEAAQKWIAANQPAARVKVLGGHMMLFEYPEAFNNAVLSFLEEN